MGMPACRITDMTAHGGVVVLGYPTVLIGNMPAARIGDLHVCPMMTGVVPHVGGPFVLGSMTVLVGMMPQSRVTDMLICAGGPDVAVQGEPTVLIGMAGMGGVVAASTGMQMSGMSAPSGGASSAESKASHLSAELQQDGTLKLIASRGTLPPITVQHRGWPDLPAAHTVNFVSVQPVTLPLGTPLSSLQDGSGAPSSYFVPQLPDDIARQVEQTASSELSRGGQMVDAVVDNPDGVKAWMGQAANCAAPDIPQIWAAPGAVACQAQQAAVAAQTAAAEALSDAQHRASDMGHALTDTSDGSPDD